MSEAFPQPEEIKHEGKFFLGFDVLLDDSLPPGCIKFLHGDGRADVFRIDGESADVMIRREIQHRLPAR